MANSSIGTSFTSTTTSSLESDQRSYESVDKNSHLNGSAKETENAKESVDLMHFKRMFSDALIQQDESNTLLKEPTWKQQDPLALHKGLEAIASSLSFLTETLGMALEEQRSHTQMTANVSISCEDLNNKAADDLSKEKYFNSPPKLQSNDNLSKEKDLRSPSKLHVFSGKRSEVTQDTQMKTSQDIAMAMTNKAKLLLRELKRIKSDLNFTKDRCTQLEEENGRLRESVDKGVRHEEDDLVRLQLEALLTEKARLAQENSAYARENQFLHEVVQYHQLKLRNIALPDDESLAFDDELSLDSAALEMDFLPMCPHEGDSYACPDERLEMAS